MILIYTTVGKYKDICTVTERLVNLYEETVDCSLEFCTFIIES